MSVKVGSLLPPNRNLRY